MKTYTLPILLTLTLSLLMAQARSQTFSPAYEEMLHQQAMKAYPVSKWDSLRCAWYGECAPKDLRQTQLSGNYCSLAKRFFGWHAIGTSSSSYQWGLLTDLSYFSYQVDPATGNATNSSQIAAWNNDATVLAALANNVRVSLCVTLFNNTSEFSTFFNGANAATAQSTLITNLINALISANAKGINIDFEGSGLSSTYLTQFTTFMTNLNTQLKAAIPTAELSIDLQGTYANSSSLLNGLLPSTDIFILMGYDYYWSGQFYPGPIAPTYQFTAAAGDPNGHGNVSNDLNNVIRYVGAGKVILAMPYYGRRWKVTNGCTLPGIGTQAALSTQTYTQFRQNSNGYYSNTLREPNTFNAYHCFTDVNAVPNQQFIDDAYSLQKKYDLIKQRGIMGGAVWRLGYDAGYTDCWDLVNDNLSTCAVTKLTDTLYDMGGPAGNYHNNQRYTFTIAPPGASAVTLTFQNFELEQGFDSLRVYDGSSTSAPLIAQLTGASLPSPVVANSGSMTLQFKSDGATTKPGYKAIYTTTIGPVVYRTISSGNWSTPGIWSTGTVPTSSDSVVISAGHSISYTTTATIKNIYISAGATLNLTDPAAQLTIGNNAAKIRNMRCDGTLLLTAGQLLIYGNLNLNAGSVLNMSGGRIIIDGNSGDAATSIANGQHLFNASASMADLALSGGVLQFIDPPLGTNSQAINCPINFGAGSTVQFGDGVSTRASNNPNGFGGDLLPTQIGKLILDAAVPYNNRIFINLNPLTLRTQCEVRSGNLVQGALLQVLN